MKLATSEMRTLFISSGISLSKDLQPASMCPIDKPNFDDAIAGSVKLR